MNFTTKVGAEIELASKEIDIDKDTYKATTSDIEAIASAVSPWAAAAGIVKNAINAFALASAVRQKANAVRYVATTEALEARYERDIRVRQSRDQRAKQILLVEKRYQAECDRIAAEEREKEAIVHADAAVALERIRRQTEISYSRIDSEYRRFVFEQEVLIKQYEDVLSDMRLHHMNIGQLGGGMIAYIQANAKDLDPETTKVLAATATTLLVQPGRDLVEAYVASEARMGADHGFR